MNRSKPNASSARALRAAAGLAIVATLFGAGPSRAIDLAISLCKPGEKAIFSCSFPKSKKGVKVASYCLTDKSLVYRFGKPGAVELEYPPAAAPATASFVRNHTSNGKGFDDILLFSNAGTTYTLDEDTNEQTGGSSASLTIEKGGKHLAQLNCADDVITNWPLLDDALPVTEPGSAHAPDEDAPADAPAPADAGPAEAATPAEGTAAKPAAPALVCNEGSEPFTGYRRTVTDLFRNYAEKSETLYAFAVDTFGPPKSCKVTASELFGKFPVEDPTEEAFMGTVRYEFAGATLSLTLGPFDGTLSTPNGFPSEAKAQVALESRAGFALKKAQPPESAEDKVAGTHSQTWLSPDGDEGSQQTRATEIFRGKKLVGIEVH